MITKITADTIFPILQEPLKDTVIIVENGKILALENAILHEPSEVKKFKGAIVPGFVNTHCHLELSHMLGRIPTGTGLLDFIGYVVKNRQASQEQIQEAIEAAEMYMLQQGIVAVGDICNTSDTFNQKKKGNLYYYNFIENFDLMGNLNLNLEYEKYLSIYNLLEENEKNQKSFVPHAPYSVSIDYFKKINNINTSVKTISIHNQETPSENIFFSSKKGNLVDFYKKLGMSLDEFMSMPNYKSALHYTLENIAENHRLLLVHNTITSMEDIEFAKTYQGQIYWATCPNANLYIENRLPNYKNFIEKNALMTIGTDSLTSNWQLSILEEIKTIRKYQSYISTDMLLEWATINGAKALHLEHKIGSLDIGKSPGFVLLENLSRDNEIQETTTCKKIL